MVVINVMIFNKQCTKSMKLYTSLFNYNSQQNINILKTC